MKVKVWNDDEYVYEEEFKGKVVTIKPHGYVEMQKNEAILFKGSYQPMSVDDNGNPHGVKRIRLEYDPIEKAILYGQPLTDSMVEELERRKSGKKGEEPKVVQFICQNCGQGPFKSQQGLDTHIRAKHAESLSKEGKEALGIDTKSN